MKIFYDKKGKKGKYFELQDVEDFPKMKKIKGIFADGVESETEKINFNYSLENVVDGSYAFYNNMNLQSFNSNLIKLENGYCMFQDCDNITTFSSDLPRLTYGNSMFYSCTNLISFSSLLTNLDNGQAMFRYCKNLTTFTSDLPRLRFGVSMFMGCKNLTSFPYDLHSLTNGIWMFDNCKLDAQSVANIVHTLPTLESNGTIDIGIGCDDTEADRLLFAQECDCETWQEVLAKFSAKNWTVEFQCTGRPTEATTYNMRRGATLPIYAKLEEVTDEKHAQYTSVDGSKFYNIHYFHSTNGSTEGYDVFSSIEEAISTYNVTPKN